MGVPEGNCATPLITQRSQVQILPPLLPQKGPNPDRFAAPLLVARCGKSGMSSDV